MMVKIPPVDPVAFQIRALLDEGRREDARKMILAQIREKYNSEEFLKVVDEFTKPKTQTRARGAPKKKTTPFLYEIGSDFLELQSEGKNYEEAIEALADKHKVSESRVRSVVALFRRADL